MKVNKILVLQISQDTQIKIPVPRPALLAALIAQTKHGPPLRQTIAFLPRSEHHALASTSAPLPVALMTMTVGS
jgi:hypothetical protein